MEGTSRGSTSRRGRRPVSLLVSLLVAAGLLAGGRLLIGSMIRSMVYPVPGMPVPSPPPAGLEEVPVEDEGGLVSAWWSGTVETPAACVLLFHGNGENLETMRRAGLFDRFRRLGWAVMAVDYPGYGRSEGEARESRILSAARAAYGVFVGRAPEGCPRIVAGWSLGAAVAVQLAASHPDEVDRLLLLSPWNRLADVAAVHFPAWMVKSLLAEKYDSVEAASRWRGPTLVIHGREDSIIPSRLGRELYVALPEPKRWVEIPDAGHNDLLGREEVWEEMGEWGRQSPVASRR